MLESKIHKGNVKYNENIGIEKEDINHMSFVYETELFDKDIEFVLGKEKHTYAKYDIIYFSVYLVINDKPKKRIGVFEIDSHKFIQSIDEDGSIELENGELIFFVQQSEMLEYFKKYNIKHNDDDVKEKNIDNVELEYEDLTDKSPDLNEESLDIFKVSVSDKKVNKQTPLKNETIFEEKNNVKAVTMLEEENEEISNNEKKKYEEKINTTWIEKFTKNNNYNIIDNEGGGDCLFATIRDAFKSIGKITTVDKLRYHLSNEMNEETYENYKSLYMAISNDYKQIKKDIEQVQASEKKLTKDINESTDRDKSDQLNELKKIEETKRKKLIRDKKQSKELLQDFVFMEDINNFEEYKQYIRSSRFWGDTWAISTLEKILNIKIMVLSEESYPDHLDDIMHCGQINDQDVELKNFRPDYYMIVSYTGNHYKLITYKDKTLFSFKEIPYDIKMMIINKCLEKNAGLYYLIQDFKRFKERMGMDPEEGKKTEDDAIHKDLYNKDIVFMFHEKSNNKPMAGMGNGESMDILQAIDSEMGFKELNNISDWRRKLDDSYETPFTVDGLRWNTVTHYYLGSQFKKGFPDFYKEFSLDSNSELSKNLVKARAAGSNNGKLKDKLLRNESIKIDPDFYEIKVNPRYELERKIALEAKFTQNLDLLQLLMNTKNAKLVNFRRGKEPIVDELLMKLRKELGSNKELLRTL